MDFKVPAFTSKGNYNTPFCVCQGVNQRFFCFFSKTVNPYFIGFLRVFTAHKSLN